MNNLFGQVCWFNNAKGYGFIEYQIENVKQKDLFVHFSDIDCQGFKSLNKGQKVSFSIGQNVRGEPKAVEVKVLV